MLKKRVEVSCASKVDGRGVQDWAWDLKPGLTSRATAAACSAKAHAMLASEEGSAVNHKLNCRAGPKPYARLC
jgi:hypothetical protein